MMDAVPTLASRQQYFAQNSWENAEYTYESTEGVGLKHDLTLDLRAH